MLKRFIFFILGMLLIIAPPSYAMIEEEEISSTKIRHHLQNSPLKQLPNELILTIAEYLYGDDFHNFSLTCWPIRTVMRTYNPFFIPVDEEKVMEIVHTTPLEKISDLIFDWSRTPKKIAITQLRKIMKKFAGYPKIEKNSRKEDLKYLKNKFKDYVKVLNILYEIGDKEAQIIYKGIDREAQICWENTVHYTDLINFNILNPNLYLFHTKNLALLSIEGRKNLSIEYQNGRAPFKKDNEKSTKVFKDINLPLFRE